MSEQPQRQNFRDGADSNDMLKLRSSWHSSATGRGLRSSHISYSVFVCLDFPDRSAQPLNDGLCARLREKGWIPMSAENNSSPLDNAAIEKMVRSVFKGDPEQLTEPLLEYVCLLVNRHVAACRRIEIKSEVYRTVIEAIEDYRLKLKTGISVLDRAPDEMALPATRLLQYISPIDVRKRKQDGGDDTPPPPPET